MNKHQFAEGILQDGRCKHCSRAFDDPVHVKAPALSKDQLLKEMEALVKRAADKSNEDEVRLAAGCMSSILGSLYDGSLSDLMDHLTPFSSRQVRENKAKLNRHKASRN
jgi:hypothetical protein